MMTKTQNGALRRISAEGGHRSLRLAEPHLSGLMIAVLLCLVAGPRHAGAQSPQDGGGSSEKILEQVRTAVRNEHLDQAAQLLAPYEKATSEEALRTYRADLIAVQNFDRDVRALYLSSGLAGVNALRTSLERQGRIPNTPELLRYIYRRTYEVQEFDRVLNDGATAYGKQDWEQVRVAYESVAANPWAGDVHRRLARERLAVADQKASPWAPLRQAIEDLPVWMARLLEVVLGIAFLGLFVGLFRWAILLNRRHEFVIYSGGGVDKAALDAGLTGRLLGGLRQLALDRDRTEPPGAVARLGDLLPEVWTAEMRGDLRSLADNIDPSQVVAVGGVKVPLRWLWTFFSELFLPRPRFLWMGVVSREAEETRLVLTRRDRLLLGQSRGWYVLVQNKDEAVAQAEVIQRAVYRIAFDEVDARRRPTQDPYAFYAYHRALRLLDDLVEAVEDRDSLARARHLLQEAVSADPDFWPARLRLGIVLRKQGELDLARAVFDDLLRAPPDELTGLELRFHGAVVDGRSGALKGLRKARHELDKLVTEIEGKLLADQLHLMTSPVRWMAPNVTDLPSAITWLREAHGIFVQGHCQDDLVHRKPPEAPPAVSPPDAGADLVEVAKYADALWRQVNDHFSADWLHYTKVTAQVAPLGKTATLDALLAQVKQLQLLISQHLADGLWPAEMVAAPARPQGGALKVLKGGPAPVASAVLTTDDPHLRPEAIEAQERAAAGDEGYQAIPQVDDEEEPEPEVQAQTPPPAPPPAAPLQPGPHRLLQLYFFTRSFRAESAALLSTTFEFSAQVGDDEAKINRELVTREARFFDRRLPPGADPKAYNLARAFALLADGRRRLDDVFNKKDLTRARDSLAQAIVCLPELVPAYVGLARTYRKQKQKSHVGWEEDARRLLDTARTLDRNDPSVIEEWVLLLGSEKKEEAEKLLLEPLADGYTAADTRPKACFLLGQLLTEKPETFLEGLARLRKASKMYSRARIFGPPEFFALAVVEAVERHGQRLETPALRKQAVRQARDAVAALEKQEERLGRLFAEMKDGPLWESRRKRLADRRQACQATLAKAKDKMKAFEGWFAADPADAGAAGASTSGATGPV